jgi:hypothetical protein
MDRDRTRADAAPTMTTLLLNQQRAGRFGREIRGDDAFTTTETDGADEPLRAIGYVVDPEAVAAAIVERLIAGRTLGPPRR